MQSDLLGKLIDQGWATATLQGPQWEHLAATVDAWVVSDEVSTYIEEYRTNRPPQNEDSYMKRYAARWLPHDRATVLLGENDPFLAAGVSDTFTSFAQAYFHGHQPALEYYDVWHTFPLEAKRERLGSQIWHKDNPANSKPRRYFKIFLYFSDCLEDGAGPMEMKSPVGQVSFLMHRGDLLFADTGGYFHRGGFNTTLSRTYALWSYYDYTTIRCKPRYNLTPEARAKFPSAALVEKQQWDKEDYSKAKPLRNREILLENYWL